MVTCTEKQYCRYESCLVTEMMAERSTSAIVQRAAKPDKGHDRHKTRKYGEALQVAASQ